MTTLHAKRILVVEDDPVIAMLLEDLVLDEGGVVVGPAATLDQALAMARDEAIDAAVLDVNLAGVRSDAVADVLVVRGIPFIFATGYGDAAVPVAHVAAPVIAKPYRLDEMAVRLATLLGAG